MSKLPSSLEPSVRAVDFTSQMVYRSAHRPGYTSWVSFFPGEHGQWYLTCEEVTPSETALQKCSRQQWYEMSLPVGYDKLGHRMEIVLLESLDHLETWQVVSRQQSIRFHHSAGSFGQARTPDGRFLRFVWSCYSLDESVAPNEILYTSADDGKTWRKATGFHDAHFASYPHRLRTLKDGTLVLCLPLTSRWGQGTDRPVRASMRLDVVNDMQMTLFYSFDHGLTWEGPLPIYAGQTVAETDFVELPDGHLLFVNSSIFACPGRQIVYRDGRRFTPGPLERVRSGTVPETVCLTQDGLLIGCLRPGSYSWSDDFGYVWQVLEGVPQDTGEVYQPWIVALPDGRIACAGHFGADDAIDSQDQSIHLHTFRMQQAGKTLNTAIHIERLYDGARQIYRNAYLLTLTCEDHPLPEKELVFWYVERDQPGYDSWGQVPLDERMKAGGTRILARTGGDGTVLLELPHLDVVENPHHSYQLIVLFNANGTDTTCKPAQTPQLEYYALSYQG